VAFGLALNGRKGQAARGAMRTRVNRHVPLASGLSGLTDRLCVRRIASGVEQVVFAPIPRPGKV
jgi:hypothetical protein